MSRFLIVLAACSLLNGCMVALTPEERAATCSVASVGEPCLTGRASVLERNQVIRPLHKQLAEEQAQKDQAQRDADERAAREQRAAAAEAAKAAAEHEVITQSARYAGRKTETFASYQDAKSALDPAEGTPVMGHLINDPMSIKSQPVTISARVLQVVDDGHLLIDPCFSVEEAAIYAGGGVQACPVFAQLTKGCGGPREFVDGQRFFAVAEVVGTYRYQTVAGSQSTIPKMLLYGIGVR